MDAQAVTPTSDKLAAQHKVDGLLLFFIMIKTGFLTVVTLGIYRFWQKTRVRNFLWAATSVDGDAFEYTGKGLEKFLGFLLAIVVLAVYLGVLQMLLFFLGLSLFNYSLSSVNLESARFMGVLYLNVIAVIPFVFYAIYQSRRYMMGRTRWRGIRMGMEKGGWGYVIRAIGYWLLTILSLGLLTPLRTFKLEKYMADRSFFGTMKMHQEGSWIQLYPALKHCFIAVFIILVGLLLGVMGLNKISIFSITVGAIWFSVGTLYYKVRSFGYLTSNKTLDGAASFNATPRTRTILRVSLIAGVGIGIMGLLASFFVASVFNFIFQQAGPFLGMSIVFVMYGFAYLFFNALMMTMLTQPILEHYISTISIKNADALLGARQREEDTETDADGFADALDLGGAV